MESKSERQTRQKIIVGCLLTLTAIAVAGALYLMGPVLIPLVLAVLISYLVAPVVDFIQIRLRFPRSLAVITALLLAIGMGGLFAMLFYSSAARLASRSSLYQEKLTELGDDVLHYVQSSGIPIDAEVIHGQLSDLPVGKIVAGFLNSILGSASTLFLVLLFVVFLVAGRSPGEKHQGIYREIDIKVRRYLVIKVSMSVLTGLLVAVILMVLDMELAVVFGMLSFLMNFIPSVGSIIATFLPLPLALVQYDSYWPILLVILLPGIVQLAIGYAIEPRIMGTSLNLHPITVLVSLIFWGILWGIPGMVLAAPISAVLKIVLDRFEATRAVGGLLAGRLP